MSESDNLVLSATAVRAWPLIPCSAAEDSEVFLAQPTVCSVGVDINHQTLK